MPDYVNVGDLAKIYVESDEIDKVYVNQDLIYSSYTPEHYLKFTSPDSFTLKTYNSSKGWDGTMERSTNGGSSWSTWSGTTITAGLVDGLYRIYLRGTGNTKITTGISESYRFSFTGSNISCIGNIEYLLDYATVAQGNHPPMASGCFYNLFTFASKLISCPELPATTLSHSCYFRMFYECTNLKHPPVLPSTSLTVQCYYGMFNGCVNLETLPTLPATTLKESCYSFMFYRCKRIGLFVTSQSNTTTYRIPESGSGINATSAMYNMFGATNGNISETPNINTTYYLSTIPMAYRPYSLSISNGTLSWSCDETDATYVIYRSSNNSTWTQMGTASNKSYSISGWGGYWFKVKTTRSGYRENESAGSVMYLTSIEDPVLTRDGDDILVTNNNISPVNCYWGINTSDVEYSDRIGAYSSIYLGVDMNEISYVCVWFEESGLASNKVYY